ncbi:MAG: ATP-binding cassette domain-containing protein, partial [Filifactoraceae bacterium]
YKIAAMILTCIIVTSFLNIYFSKKIIGYSKKFYELQNKFYGYQKELIDQYDWTILTDMRRVALKRYFKYSTDVKKSEEKVVKKNNETYVIALLNEYLPTILYMFIIVLNIDNENLSYGEVLALMSIVSTVSLPFTHTLRSFVALRKSVPFMEDMNGLLVKKEINNIQFLERKNNECLIDMENVTVMYDDKKVLQISNLKIFNGDKIAIIGETGSGKTTFFKLILGLLNFSEGKVIVYSDSKIDDLKSFWSKVSYLDNNTHIFNGSLYYNVTFNNDLSAKKSDEKYFDIINKLDLGKLEDRELYQHGKNLSGGQKMKICFARALYNDSEILLLDEPIASLDKESEQDIIELLKNMKKTILIITHRKNVLNICSRVLSVESGMINEK